MKMAEKPKLFVAWWERESHYISGKPNMKEMNLDSFTEDGGYTLEEIKEIDTLKVAQTWTAQHPVEIHMIMRVK
jgi:hypothetical protein